MRISEDQLVRSLISQRRRILAYIWSIVHDEHLAEDILQDVFMVACKKAAEAQITDEEHMYRWIRKIARFESLNAARKVGRSHVVFESTLLDQLDVIWDKGDAMDAERIAALHECVSRLSGYAKRLISMRYVERLSGESIASRVDRKVGTVYTALSRIHAALRQCVADKTGLNHG